MKCAIIEYYPYHDLTFPTLIVVLQQLGIDEIDIFTSQSNIDRNIWHATETSASKIQCSDGKYFRFCEYLRKYRKYDFLILNTIDPPKAVLQQFAKSHIPTLGIMHNASQYRKDQNFKQYFNFHPRSRMLVLDEYVAEYLADVTHAHWFSPCYQGRIQRLTTSHPNRTIFCVQGLIEYCRRNYQSLIEAAAQLRDQGMTNFTIRLIGGACQSPNYQQFTHDIEQRGLRAFFEFTTGDVPYQIYFANIQTSNFLLFLLDTTTPEYSAYATEKVSSSLAMSLGLGILPVVHQQFSTIYGLGHSSITYENGLLAGAMHTALSLHANEKEQKHQELQAIQRRLLQQSEDNIKTAIHDILA